MNKTTFGGALFMQSEDLVQHFSGGLNPPDCLPFPAGPLLLRQATHSPPLLPQRLKNPDRVALAYRLFPQEKGEQRGTDKSYLGLHWRLHSASCATWGCLHGQEYLENEVCVLSAWAQLLKRQPTETLEAFERRKNKPLELIQERLKSQQQRPRKTTTHGELETPYTVPAYTCQCHVPAVASAPLIQPNAVQVHAAASAYQQDPWAVLQRFWFKQLHSHHAQAWDLYGDLKYGDLKYIVPYHKAALGVLHQLQQQPDHPLAPVARALTVAHLLPPTDREALKAWYEKLQSTQNLPPALCPTSMGSPLHSLQWMLAMQGQIGLAESVIRAVDTLAREVASLMTDPWLGTQLHWTKEEVQAIQGRLDEKSKPREREAFLKQVDDRAGFTEILLRRRAMEKYLKWSAESWHQRSQAPQSICLSRTTP
jgi:hypothetical protein